MSTTRALLAEFAREASSTRRLLEQVPVEHLGWRPHEKSMTLGRLVGHIAEIPGWTTAVMEQDELDLAADELATPLEPSSMQDLLVEFGGHVSDFHLAVAGAGEQALEAIWTLRRGARVIVAMPRLAALRSFVLNHVVHHRGQLTVYLRMLDVALPQVYGPTADQSDFTVEETESKRGTDVQVPAEVERTEPVVLACFPAG